MLFSKKVYTQSFIGNPTQSSVQKPGSSENSDISDAFSSFDSNMKNKVGWTYFLFLSRWLKKSNQNQAFMEKYCQINILSQLSRWISSLKADQIKNPIEKFNVQLLLQMLNSIITIGFDSRQLQVVMAQLNILIREKSEFSDFKVQFLKLCMKIYQYAPEMIPFEILSIQLSDQLEIHDEFYAFMGKNLGKDDVSASISFETMSSLQQGFLKRVSIDIQTKNWTLKPAKMQNILSCIENTIKWQKANSKDNYILRKFLENSKFIQASIICAGATQKYNIIEAFFQFLVDDRLGQKFNRYEFILNKILRHFLKKESYSFISLNYSCLISDENGFERWWIQKELDRNKSTDFIDTYTSNRGGIRFVLGMIANFVYDFWSQREYVINYLNSIDFLALIKFQLDDEIIRNLLKHYYELIQDDESIERLVEVIQSHEIVRRVRNN